MLGSINFTGQIGFLKVMQLLKLRRQIYAEAAPDTSGITFVSRKSLIIIFCRKLRNLHL